MYKTDKVNRGRKVDKVSHARAAASGAVGLGAGAERSEAKPRVRLRKAFGGLFVLLRIFIS